MNVGPLLPHGAEVRQACLGPDQQALARSSVLQVCVSSDSSGPLSFRTETWPFMDSVLRYITEEAYKVKSCI